jgi:hypothetical protein
MGAIQLFTGNCKAALQRSILGMRARRVTAFKHGRALIRWRLQDEVRKEQKNKKGKLRERSRDRVRGSESAMPKKGYLKISEDR